MQTFPRILLAVLSVPILLVLGCGDADTPTGLPNDQARPSASLLDASLLDDGLGELDDELGDLGDDLVGTLSTLRRTDGIEQGWCAEEVRIGRWGGTVECPEAGLRLVFPRGAVTRTEKISVWIPDGDLVGYEFHPHGLEFRKEVRLIQELDGTEAAERTSLLEELVGAYVDEVGDTVEPLELFSIGLLDGSGDADDPEAVFFDIEHFSGYVCATN